MPDYDRVALRTTLQGRFSLDELKGICYDLGIDYDNLGGDTKAEKVLDLLQYLFQRQQVPRLITWIQANRGDIDVSAFVIGGAPAAPPNRVEPVGGSQQPVSTSPSNQGGQSLTRPSTPTPVPAGQRWQYVDFDVAIRAGSADEYEVHVFSSPVGEVSGTTVLRLDEPAITAGLAALAQAQFNTATVQALGERLMTALLVDDVRDAYFATLGRANSQQVGIRLRLRVEPPALKHLPWEYLFDRQLNSFLATNSRMVVSRYLEVRQDYGSTARPDTLRMLLILSNPLGVPKLDLAGEEARIRDAVKPLLDNGHLTLDVLTNPQPRDIRRQLRNNVYHIVQYSGHAVFATQDARLRVERSDDGLRAVPLDPTAPAAPPADRGFVRPATAAVDVRKNTGYVVLPDDSGGARLMDEDGFALFFNTFQDIRLIVLNACEGGQSSATEQLAGLGDKLVQLAAVPAVVAMQYPIADDAAKTFAAEFYQALADGLPIDAALAQARLALYQECNPDNRAWGTPVLFMRARDGRLFA